MFINSEARNCSYCSSFHKHFYLSVYQGPKTFMHREKKENNYGHSLIYFNIWVQIWYIINNHDWYRMSIDTLKEDEHP